MRAPPGLSELLHRAHALIPPLSRLAPPIRRAPHSPAPPAPIASLHAHPAIGRTSRGSVVVPSPALARSSSGPPSIRRRARSSTRHPSIAPELTSRRDRFASALRARIVASPSALVRRSPRRGPAHLDPTRRAVRSSRRAAPRRAPPASPPHRESRRRAHRAGARAPRSPVPPGPSSRRAGAATRTPAGSRALALARSRAARRPAQRRSPPRSRATRALIHPAGSQRRARIGAYRSRARRSPRARSPRTRRSPARLRARTRGGGLSRGAPAPLRVAPPSPSVGSRSRLAHAASRPPRPRPRLAPAPLAGRGAPTRASSRGRRPTISSIRCARKSARSGCRSAGEPAVTQGAARRPPPEDRRPAQRRLQPTRRSIRPCRSSGAITTAASPPRFSSVCGRCSWDG